MYIQAACGGEGACGKCRVTIAKGQVALSPSPKVPEEDFARGVRLACQRRILSDLEVRIPVESDLDKRILSRTQDHPRGGRKVSYQELESLVLGWCFGPALRKYLVEMEPPTIQDNRSDLDPVCSSP